MFSLNSDIFFITVKGFEPASLVSETGMLPRSRKDTYQRQDLQINPNSGLVINQIPWIHWISIPFRENSIEIKKKVSFSLFDTNVIMSLQLTHFKQFQEYHARLKIKWNLTAQIELIFYQEKV